MSENTVNKLSRTALWWMTASWRIRPITRDYRDAMLAILRAHAFGRHVSHSWVSCYVTQLVKLDVIPHLSTITFRHATSAVRDFAAARRAAHSSSDCWRPSVRCCRSDALEQSSTWHYRLCVTDVILPETENFFVFYIISMTTFLVVLQVFI